MIEKDEIHLILEYHAKEAYDGLESPTANRFIVSHDIYNSNMMMLEQFFESIKEYEPDLIILSGLHLLENQTPITRLDKLLLLKDNLVENHDYKNVIHLELASIGDKALMKAILDVVSNRYRIYVGNHGHTCVKVKLFKKVTGEG